MSDIKYTTVQPPRPAGDAGFGRIQGRQAAGAAAGELLHQGMMGLANWALECAIQDEIERKLPQIQAAAQAAPGSTGVLVVVYVQTWKIPDMAGYRAAFIHYSYVYKAGTDTSQVTAEYGREKFFAPCPPNGYLHVPRYLWVTPPAQR